MSEWYVQYIHTFLSPSPYSTLHRYLSAPEESDNYPDKNQQASALSTSIITHRYLVEAAVYPESMILHFEDISSIHALVLKVGLLFIIKLSLPLFIVKRVCSPNSKLKETEIFMNH